MKAILEKYLQIFPAETERLRQLTDFLRATPDGPQLYDRKNFGGHITASGFILSPDRNKLALVKHKFLHRFLQPGGHVEPGDPTVLAAAEREIIEETNLQDCRYLPFHADAALPLDIDTHPIPANPKRNEPPHPHHDFRFLFCAASEGVPGGECDWSWVELEQALADETFAWVRPKIMEGRSLAHPQPNGMLTS